MIYVPSYIVVVSIDCQHIYSLHTKEPDNNMHILQVRKQAGKTLLKLTRSEFKPNIQGQNSNQSLSYSTANLLCQL